MTTTNIYAYPTGGVPRMDGPTVNSGWEDNTIKVPPKVTEPKAHNHYFKNVKGLDYIDVYRVLQLFSVTDPCIQHAIKKLLVAGGRGAGKSIEKDIQEAIDSLKRWQEMQTEAK